MRIFKYCFAPAPVLLFCLAASAHAQWTDVKKLGQGGESTVATDGKGNVYVAAHEPCEVYVSHDYGASFANRKEFPDGFCDMDVIAWPSGRVNVSFIKPNVSGLASYYSMDNGESFLKGSAIDGPLDREWLAPNLINGDLYMDYSHGYIGGPKSTGVFLATSKNQGKTFEQTCRIDQESSDDHPVDPYLVSSSDGRIYAMWSTTRDDNTIDRYDFAYSTDGGKTFKGHQVIGTIHKALGDSQERWMLGALTSSGKSDVLALYADYAKVEVDGNTYKPLLIFYRLSTDGGASFSEPQTVSSTEEIQQSIRQYQQRKHTDSNVGYYLQTLPWACADGYGHFHVVFEDNRSGQAQTNDTYFNRWQVRMATLSGDGTFGDSEQVSHAYVSKRPPLDFISCAADKRRLYVSWTETPGSGGDWNFTGELFVGRKILRS